MANWVSNQFLVDLLEADIDLNADTIKVLLCGATFALDDEDSFLGDGTLGELSGTGYVAGHGNSGRHTLANVTVTKNNPSDQAIVDADDVSTWTGIDAGTVEWVVFAREGTTNDTDALVVCAFDVSKATNGGDLTVQVANFMTLTRASGS